MRWVRAALGALGVVFLGVGAYLLLSSGQSVRDIMSVAGWLAGAVAIHDIVVAPMVIAAGFLLVRGPARGAVRAGLVVAGALTAVAFPVLMRPGTPRNPSVLPLDYWRNWSAALGLVAAATALASLAAWAAARRRAAARGPGRRPERGPTAQR